MKVASAPPGPGPRGSDADQDDHRGGGTLLAPGPERSTPRRDTVTQGGRPTSLSRSLLGRAKALFLEPPAWLPIAILVHNQFLFAGMHVIAKPALHYIPPFALAMLRIGLATPFLFLLGWREGSFAKITRKDMPYMALLGTVGVALPQSLIFVANSLAGPSIIAILSPAAPVYAAIFAALLKIERMTLVKAGGILLAVSGALVVLRPDKMDLSRGHPTDVTAGIMVMVVQTMCYAAFLVALKIKLTTHPYPFGIYAYASLIGFVLLAIFSAITGVAYFDIATIPGSAWGAVIYCGIVISFFAHACQSWAVAYTSASLPAIFSCLSPFLTGFLAYIVLGERMGSASDIIGLFLNVTGLVFVIYSKVRLEGSRPSTGNGGGGGGGSSVVKPMPAEAGATAAGEEEESEDEPAATAKVVAAATVPTMLLERPAFVPQLKPVPEEAYPGTAPPSPIAGAAAARWAAEGGGAGGSAPAGAS